MPASNFKREETRIDDAKGIGIVIESKGTRVGNRLDSIITLNKYNMSNEEFISVSNAIIEHIKTEQKKLK